jgi:hypothetical protein
MGRRASLGLTMGPRPITSRRWRVSLVASSPHFAAFSTGTASKHQLTIVNGKSWVTIDFFLPVPNVAVMLRG